MIRSLAILALSLGVALPVRAERGPVFVELFTAQGCASCPPADALLAELAQSPDVVAVALHVDYWDYLGWEDDFGDPRFSARQHRYMERSGAKMVFTPQMVLDGQRFVVGGRRDHVAAALAERVAEAQPVKIDLTLGEEGAREVRVSLSGHVSVAQPCEIYLAVVDPLQVVTIGGGENSGKIIEYVNILRDISSLDQWDGQAREFVVSLPVGGKAALFVQEQGAGHVLAARWLN